ncbi:hypothetical protein V5O48_008272 [Marasmius crinis-equi]|uniref:Uncharacterized protein n=1 Tax=Marasmius crinis-equi TaxID=585013 RepID=A0ABR3FEC2_9AGAR
MCSRSYQWKHATIRAGVKGFKLLAPYSGLFPLLSTLRLHFEEDNWGQLTQGITDDIFSVFRVAPELSKLTLSGRSGPVARHLLTQIPWKQITRFTIERKRGDDLTDIRPIVPLLTSVSSCDIGEFKFTGAPLTPPSTLRHLHSLKLGACSEAGALFDSLTLPGLRKLSIAQCFPPILKFQQFLERSSCQLTELALMYVEQRGLIEALRAPAVQGVETLLIGPLSNPLAGVDDEVLHGLRLKSTTNDSGSENILRNLRVLYLWGTKGWSDPCLVEILASRVNPHHTLCPSVSRLQSIRFEIFISAGANGLVIEDEAAREQMKGLVSDGLVVRVNGKNVVF